MITKTIPLREGRNDVTLTTYIVDDSREMMDGRKRPAILIAPGGGYLMCSDREGEPVALRFAAMGYHAFVVRYSVYFHEGEEPDYTKELPARPETVHPAPVQDYGLAMKYIYEHAEEWLVDTERIAICGFSAGCHNSAMYAAYWNKPLLTDFLGVEEGYRPAAAILGYGVFDNYSMRDCIPEIKYPDLCDAYRVALMGSANPGDELRKATSPALKVDESFPPTFIWSTIQDDAVPVIQTADMGRRLIEKNIPTEMHIFETGGHGLSLATQATSAALSNCVPDVAVWVDMADRWLQKRFELPLPKWTIWEEQGE